MTLAEARAVQPGDYIASPHDNPEWRVRRVTERWANADSSIVRVKIAGYSQVDWVDLAGFVKCPAGYRNGDVLKPEHRPVSDRGGGAGRSVVGRLANDE